MGEARTATGIVTVAWSAPVAPARAAVAAAVAALAAWLSLPALASARVVELGARAPQVKSACPNLPCAVLAATTGYQGRSDSLLRPFVVPDNGYIVAFTLTLSNLADNQIQFFNDTYGSPARVRLSIIRQGRTRKTRRDFRLLQQSDWFNVEPYLGSAPTFVLQRPLRVRKGHIVAITTDTWVPAFVTNVSGRNWWRASRERDKCRQDVFEQAAHLQINLVRQYWCDYHGDRLMYTATFIPDPTPTRTVSGQTGSPSGTTTTPRRPSGTTTTSARATTARAGGDAPSGRVFAPPPR
ncbi:hypothetical protein JDY09_06755 [Thermoleophilum album]|uniref:hypothetical protein n=1 Tax=Thermoleophilum album TaxID=29539 RepID=UPI00237C99A1|nr:hypothetical protein [Thermoleophilum album]WDT93085.1 hypothetical protein JDY09_06755 [Thermoleophilum album]